MLSAALAEGYQTVVTSLIVGSWSASLLLCNLSEYLSISNRLRAALRRLLFRVVFPEATFSSLCLETLMLQKCMILELFSECERVLYFAVIQLNDGEKRCMGDAKGSNLPVWYMFCR